jgi:hypothetical protein
MSSAALEDRNWAGGNRRERECYSTVLYVRVWKRTARRGWAEGNMKARRKSCSPPNHHPGPQGRRLNSPGHHLHPSNHVLQRSSPPVFGCRPTSWIAPFDKPWPHLDPNLGAQCPSHPHYACATSPRCGAWGVWDVPIASKSACCSHGKRQFRHMPNFNSRYIPFRRRSSPPFHVTSHSDDVSPRPPGVTSDSRPVKELPLRRPRASDASTP